MYCIFSACFIVFLLFQQAEQICYQQFGRNVWVNNIQIDQKPALRDKFIEVACHNWEDSSDNQNMMAVVDILVLLLVGCEEGKSGLVQQVESGIAKKKLQFLLEHLVVEDLSVDRVLLKYIEDVLLEEKEDEEDGTEDGRTIIRKAQDKILDMEDGQDSITTIVDLEALSEFNMKSEVVYELVKGLRKIDEFKEDAMKIKTIIKGFEKLPNYKAEDFKRLASTELFLYKKSQEVLKASELELWEKNNLERTKLRAFEELKTTGFAEKYIKKEFQHSFKAIMLYRLSERMVNGRLVLEELLSGGGFGNPENMYTAMKPCTDKMIFCLAAIYMLSNHTCKPSFGKLISKEQVEEILMGRMTSVQNNPSLYSAPPLRRILHKEIKRTHDEANDNSTEFKQFSYRSDANRGYRSSSFRGDFQNGSRQVFPRGRGFSKDHRWFNGD